MNRNLGGVAWQSLLLGSLTVSGILIFNLNRVLAQVIPDNTLGDESSVVNPRDATSDKIDGGAIRGQNLFHSFQEFNIDAGRGVYFTNPDDIANIFSRVTGNNVSNILGTLGVDGAANLFFLNPNGIIFGENASLDVQGSFAATTANGIRFGEQGDFNTINPQSLPLLTINPSAYLFNQIANQDINGIQSQGFLEVPEGKNLVFLGGDIELTGSTLTAPGGRIEIGSLEKSGLVEIHDESSLSFPEEIAKGNIFLSDSALVSVLSGGKGSILVNSENLDLISGSNLSAGIGNSLGAVDAQAGNIVVNVSDTISLDNSQIFNSVGENAVGDAGGIDIITFNLALTNGGIINAATFGQGNGGVISVNASGTISIDGIVPNSQFSSGIFNSVGANAVGDAGRIDIITSNLALTNGGVVNAATFGQGNGGVISVNASGTISIDGVVPNSQFSSGIFNSVRENAVGDAGRIDITTSNLALTNGGVINATTFGEGDGGAISVNASGTISIDGVVPNSQFSSGIFNSVAANAVGDAGDIDINTSNLNLTNGGTISSSTLGLGRAGSILINASDSVTFEGENITSGSGSGTISLVNLGAKGDGGDITITTGSFFLTQGGRVSATTFGEGDGGAISVNASGTISIDGVDPNGQFSSGIFNSVEANAVGDAGDIDINTSNLNLTNGGAINASTFGEGDGGEITINVSEKLSLDGATSNGEFVSGIANNVRENAVGDAGGIDITTSNLALTNGGVINATTFGEGDGGVISINASGTISIDGVDPNGQFSSGIFNSVEANAVGDAGDIDINTSNLNLTNGGAINASTFGEGDGGEITINVSEKLFLDGATSNGEFVSGIANNVGENAVGDGGGIDITTSNLSLTNGGVINASTFGQGNAGNIFIKANRSVSLIDDSNIQSGVRERGFGNGGDVEIQTKNLTLTNGSQIGSFVFRAEDEVPGGKGNGGNIKILATDTINISGINTEEGFSSGLVAITEQGAKGNAGNINVSTGILRISNSGELSSGTRNTGNGGNITVNANNLEITQGGQIRVTSRDAGNAGKINLNITDTIFISGSDPTFVDVLERFGENRVSEAGPASGIFSNATEASTGNAGSLVIDTRNLFIQDEATIDVSSQGTGSAGSLIIDSNQIELNNQGSITALTQSGLGGNINIRIHDNLILNKNSDVTAQAFNNANGGNITISADSIIAFDDSDIFAFAADGQGGNITLNTPAYFGENFTLNSLTSNPDDLDNNSRADINATGAVSGEVSVPDVSFIQNSLTELQNNAINTDELVANSCVVRSRQNNGSFIISGSDSLPLRPGNAEMSEYPTGEVRSVPDNNNSRWQPGDPIIEPQGVYRLTNGKFVLSRECPE